MKIGHKGCFHIKQTEFDTQMGYQLGTRDYVLGVTEGFFQMRSGHNTEVNIQPMYDAPQQE